MSAEGAKSRFDRGLVELQVGLKILPIGVARTGAWNYAFNYEIVQRHFPDLPQQAYPIKRSEARSWSQFVPWNSRCTHPLQQSANCPNGWRGR
jgi:hypothetical protein